MRACVCVCIICVRVCVRAYLGLLLLLSGCLQLLAPFRLRGFELHEPGVALHEKRFLHLLNLLPLNYGFSLRVDECVYVCARACEYVCVCVCVCVCIICVRVCVRAYLGLL